MALVVTASSQPAAAAGVQTGAPVIASPVRNYQGPSQINVNGTPVTFDQSWMMVDGTLMVPLRKVVEAAGGQVEWAGDTQTAIVHMGTYTTLFTVGQATAEHRKMGVLYKTAPIVQMDHTADLMGNRTLVSVAALTDVLGFSIQPPPYPALNLTWDEASQS
jgi:hypothetical protein